MSEPKQSRVFLPGEAESFWQPEPANGFVELRVSKHSSIASSRFETGIQVVSPGGYVREHQHNDQEELILVFEGEGIALVEGQEYPMCSGTTIYLAPHGRHKFTNTGKGPLKFFWVFMPEGLASFFARIGRPKKPGESVPASFSRPQDVEAIERETAFGKLEGE
ncbi:cupin domain-containing protein [Endozoicomonas arenosclerae]|uniref:cupin domain-containing protein n=1 Tax=Endozoicomonas arenosclerae TaxID=1633495 RepID=UPI000780A9EA|nr:cupin domain-containing protein [Endozoicomonas arenosclerae]